tara:strand:+ start:69 stop:761 length:693 start_codon:yes stop_codon:yes gene_type:complete
LKQAERNKISTWIPSNGTGIGLWKGRRVYYVNGKRQSGLTIRNPVGDSIGNTLKGLTIQGAKDLYTITGARSIVENPGSLGILDPRVWQAAVRTRKNIAQLGVKPPKEQSEEVRLRIAENQAKLMTVGFSNTKENKKLINQDKQELKNLKAKITDPVELEKITKMENLANNNQDLVNNGFPANSNNIPTEEPTIKVDKKKDFKRRRNMFELTKEEQKKIIMTSLEQEMYW